MKAQSTTSQVQSRITVLFCWTLCLTLCFLGAITNAQVSSQTSNQEARIIDTYQKRVAKTGSDYKHVASWEDQFGRVYLGEIHLWRMMLNSGQMVELNGTGARYNDIFLDEAMDSSHALCSIKCISFSRLLNSLTGYVLYENGSIFYHNYYTGVGCSKLGFHRIFYADFEKKYRPKDIVCDQGNPERVWVACQAINATSVSNYRIYYSANGGIHWVDVSKGLPNKLQRASIFYQEASNSLYCVSDVGMFRLAENRASDSVAWKPFLPLANDTINTQMKRVEFYYKEGKLYCQKPGSPKLVEVPVTLAN